MSVILDKAILPKNYDNYVFDLYGTLVDIHTDESKKEVWEKLALFFGYYGAAYTSEELREHYELLTSERESRPENSRENARYAHEAYPEIELTDVFVSCIVRKELPPTEILPFTADSFSACFLPII